MRVNQPPLALILGVVVSTALLTACGAAGSSNTSRAAAEASSQWPATASATMEESIDATPSPGAESSSASASATMEESIDATPSPGAESGISTATSDKLGMAGWDERAPASVPETATLTLHVGKRQLTAQRLANGRELSMQDDRALPLYPWISCTFGCRTDGPRLWFNLPSADGPLAFTAPTTEVPGALSWQIMLSKYNWPAEGFESAYPNQVVFTGIQSDCSICDTSFTERGFTRVALGDQVGSGIKSWLAPAKWPAPDSPMIGELRLFRAGTALPSGWIVSDGRALAAKDEGLSYLLKGAGFVQGDAARTPTMPKVTGYTWAIAAEGDYPDFDN
jgi:hypothetical protein